MAATTHAEQPHLVSLVLQSKKALQHGEQLCSRAHARSNASAQAAVDVLALDAKVRWISDTVIEQLKLAASVAKNIEEKRTYLLKQAQTCDVSRKKHTDALDTILESLGAHLVPPEFHQSSAESSLFGSQHSQSDSKLKDKTTSLKRSNGLITNSPSSTLRNQNGSRKDKQDDRKQWKTLRDFVDDQAIEDVLEIMENDRASLDDLLSQTDSYPETLNRTIASIHSSLPEPEPGPSALTKIQDTLIAQDKIVSSMALLLENLASHYDQMASALKDSEAGDTFNQDDLQDMNRDTEELPLIMSELDESATIIDRHHEQLLAAQDGMQKDLEHLSSVLDDLEELGEIMDEMLQAQESVDAKFEDALNILVEHLGTLDHLRDRFVAYQTAFNKLVLEIARRTQYREAVDNIIRGMSTQLSAMTEEENQVRTHFNSEYGAHLPEDLCLCIGNAPTKWEVLPWQGDIVETLPHIPSDLIADARDRINAASGPPRSSPGAESQ